MNQAPSEYFSKLLEGKSEKQGRSERSGNLGMANRIRSQMLELLERKTQEELIKSSK